MEKIIQLSKQVIFEMTSSHVWRTVVSALFIQPESVPSYQRLHTSPKPNFTNRGDHLFLPDTSSTKEMFLFPTVIGVMVVSTLGIGLIAVIATLMSVSIVVVISGLITLFYFVFMLFKLTIIASSLKTPLVTASAEQLASLSDEDLPIYTVLVPLRDEAEVIEQIKSALGAIEYPPEKLNLIITVEQNDHATKAALARAQLPTHWQILELPDTAPKTKPKALNCAFLEALGDYLVIYDAEIIPDPDQLKKAICIFKDNPTTAILQPRLDHYNTYQNLLTRLFTIEFTFHYDLFLPGLARFMFPIPLSGHSTHFRVSALRECGAWDPYNVAEDCEIGMRLFRRGYRSNVFDSISREEAASTLSSWVKQRTRWMKGFIQTTIVHLRYPRHTRREMGGWRNFLVFLLVVPGTVLVNLLNIFMMSLFLAWILFQPAFIQTLYPLPILYTANVVAIIGGFLFVYFTMISLYRRGKFDLVRWWFCQPLYWLLLSYATMRSIIQLITSPHVWEKTVHGTHLPTQPHAYENT